MAAALKGHKISVCGADSCVDLFITVYTALCHLVWVDQ